MKELNRQSGFSLIELMAVLAIVGLLSTVVAVGSSYSERMFLFQVGKIKGFLVSAQTYSTAHQKPVIVMKDSGVYRAYEYKRGRFASIDSLQEYEPLESMSTQMKIKDSGRLGLYGIPEDSLVLFPSGMVSEGSVEMRMNGLFQRVAWDAFLEFERGNG